MPSSRGSPDDNIPTSSWSTLKRKSPVQQTSSATKSPSHPSTSDSKRLKTSHTSANPGRALEMVNSVGITARPKVIDLTRPSNFQPSAGAKRLAIKNLRTTPRQDVDEYYNRTKADIDSALTAVFNQKQPSSPLEVLCRGVEVTCRRGEAEELFKHYRERCRTYLDKNLLPLVEQEADSSTVGALRAVHKYWTLWNTQSTLLRSIFSYLDRSYLLNAKDLPQLEDLGIDQFRHAVFKRGRTKDGEKLGEKVISDICALVAYDRHRQHELFDASLLRESIKMLHIFGNYTKLFEPKFWEESGEFFETFAQDRASSDMKDYITACDALLAREATRCDTYNFDSTTKRYLLDHAHIYLIDEMSHLLLDQAGLAKLIDINSMISLKALYSLLSLSNIQSRLKAPFEVYIKTVGSSIVIDKEKGDEMVVRLLELKRSLDLIIRDAFEKDETFSYSLREAFGNFMNDSKNMVAWGTRNSKVGEMIAKYMDMLLRGGLKAVPRSLLSDAQSRDEAEKQGQSSTGDEDAELDRQLEQALELFRFIEGKDVFEAFYKKDLARRLLMARSASQDAERNMLAKLKVECGYTFTHNLEQMFKDQEIARDEMIAYKQSLSNTSKTTMDLQVSVLFAAAWPSYPDVKVNLPIEVTKHIEKYDRFYMNKHTGRRLDWKHALAHSVVKTQFKKGPKELLVSAFQAIVLVLFNDIASDEALSYTTIQETTGLIDAELERTLQSLACAKFRVLTKHPKSRDVKHTDTFTVNLDFTDPKFKIKINQIQLKETVQENQETHERVAQDRQYETQAAIVRIMKSRKTMTHANLVAEVIEQTKKRGAVELPQIKTNIDKLIDKEYLERVDGGAYMYCA